MVVSIFSLLYFMGLFLFCSISMVGSWCVRACRQSVRTTTMSLPRVFLKALVHLTFLGLRFILKFLWHLEVQKRKSFHSEHIEKSVCTPSRHFSQMSCRVLDRSGNHKTSTSQSSSWWPEDEINCREKKFWHWLCTRQVPGQSLIRLCNRHNFAVGWDSAKRPPMVFSISKLLQVGGAKQETFVSETPVTLPDCAARQFSSSC